MSWTSGSVLKYARAVMFARARLVIPSLIVAGIHVSGQSPDIVGSWRGTSMCADKARFPACKDEHVIYDVHRNGNARDTVTLRADKVVNGVREFMAEFDFRRAPDSSWVANYENPRVHLQIVLRVRGAHMTGVVTDEPSGRRVRDLSLERIP